MSKHRAGIKRHRKQASEQWSFEVRTFFYRPPDIFKLSTGCGVCVCACVCADHVITSFDVDAVWVISVLDRSSRRRHSPHHCQQQLWLFGFDYSTTRGALVDDDGSAARQRAARHGTARHGKARCDAIAGGGSQSDRTLSAATSAIRRRPRWLPHPTCARRRRICRGRRPG